jgi:hypothetical protein
LLSGIDEVFRAFGMDIEFIRKKAQELCEMLAKYDDVNQGE